MNKGGFWTFAGLKEYRTSGRRFYLSCTEQRSLNLKPCLWSASLPLLRSCNDWMKQIWLQFLFNLTTISLSLQLISQFHTIVYSLDIHFRLAPSLFLNIFLQRSTIPRRQRRVQIVRVLCFFMESWILGEGYWEIDLGQVYILTASGPDGVPLL